MVILGQGGKLLINADNVVGVYPDGLRIIASGNDGQEYTLGKYDSDKRVEEVYCEVIKRMIEPQPENRKARAIVIPQE